MTEKKKVKIARITVMVKGKEVSLPVSEAKELFEGLKEIFEGQEQKTVFVPYYPYSYPYYPSYPTYPTYPEITWTNTCGHTTDRICLNGDSQTSSSDFSITSGAVMSSNLCVSASN